MSTIPYEVEFAPRTEGQLEKIPKYIRDQILKRIEKLKINPRPVGTEPLEGADQGLFRLRQGEYRIVYCIQDRKLLVLIVRVVHRREVYKKKHSK